jgi:hypothetical protein
MTVDFISLEKCHHLALTAKENPFPKSFSALFANSSQINLAFHKQYLFNKNC